MLFFIMRHYEATNKAKYITIKAIIDRIKGKSCKPVILTGFRSQTGLVTIFTHAGIKKFITSCSTVILYAPAGVFMSLPSMLTKALTASLTITSRVR